MTKNTCKQIGLLSGGRWDRLHDISRRVYDVEGLSPTVHTAGGGNQETKIAEEVYMGAIRGRNPENPSDRTAGAHTEQRLEINRTGCSNTITTVQKDNVVVKIMQRPRGKNSGGELDTDICPTITSSHFEQNTALGLYTNASERFDRGPLPDQSRSLRAMAHTAGVLLDDGRTIRVRQLTPLECWRLMGQTDKAFYKAKAALIQTHYKGKDKANTQLYKQAGNSIVVPVLSAVFGNIKGIDKSW